MSGNRKVFFAMLVVLACLSQSPASAGDDLYSLYSLARSKDPVIGKSQARLDIGRADVDLALAQMLPRIDANAGVNLISNTSLNYTPSEISGSYTGSSYGFSTRLPLFQMPNVFNLAASRAGVRGAEAALAGSAQDVMVTVAEAYFGLLKAQADEVLYRDELKRLELIHDQAQEAHKSGTGTIISVIETRAKLDSVAAEAVKATAIRKLTALQLENIVGRQVTDIFDLGPYQPRGPEPESLEWWLETMQKNNHELIQARELLAKSEFQQKSALAGHLPTLNASGGYAVNKGSTFLPEVETRQWWIGLNLAVSLYSGGETDARTRRALAATSEQDFILKEVREQGTQKLRQAFLNLEYNSKIIPSLLQKRASAVLQLEATREGRSVGTHTLVDLLNVEQGVAVSERDLASALYDNALRHLQLKSAAGILKEEDLREINSMLVRSPGGERFLPGQTQVLPK